MRRLLRLSRTIAAVFGVGGVVAASAFATAGSASAATLYTDSTHTTTVPVGTQATAVLSSPTIAFNGLITNASSDSTLVLSLATNSGDEVVANIITGTFTNSSPLAVSGNFATPWQLVISGSSSVSGSNLVWASSSVNDVSVNIGSSPLGGTFTGSLTSGVSAVEPSSGEAPVSLDLVNASSLSNPTLGSGTATGSYTLTGAAASYSLG